MLEDACDGYRVGEERSRDLYPGSQIAANHLAAHEFIYSNAAATIPYGTTCYPGATLIADRPPFAGDEFFRLTATPALYQDLVIFAVSFAQANTPLSPYGFPAACSLAVDPNGAFTFVMINPNPFGNASFTLPLPDAPVFFGDLFIQAAVLPGSGTPFVTPGLEVRVR